MSKDLGNKKFRLLSVGAPLLDLLSEVDDAFLSSHVSGSKGGMEMVDSATQQAILAKLPGKTRLVPGGSAANTAFALAHLGLDCAILGKIGNDEHGRFYRNRFKELGGGDEAFFETNEQPTGTCLSLVTPDAERTMRTNLGASSLLRPEEVEQIDFTQYNFVYIEGYMLYSAVLPLILQKAKAAGCQIGLDLASFEVVRTFREQLPNILKEFVDVAIANEEEAAQLYPELPLEEQLVQLSLLSETAVIKLGRYGAMTRRGDKTIHTPAELVEHPVDTTAAGDLWAAGFLYALAKKCSLGEAAWLGAKVSGEVVKVFGSELPEEVWGEIRESIRYWGISEE